MPINQLQRRWDARPIISNSERKRIERNRKHIFINNRNIHNEGTGYRQLYYLTIGHGNLYRAQLYIPAAINTSKYFYHSCTITKLEF